MSVPQELLDHAKRATARIADGRERREAYDEMVDGLASRYEDALASGLDPAEALRATLDAAGSADAVAPDLDRVHRITWTPRTTALLVAGIVAFVAVFVLVINLLFFIGSKL